MRTFAYYQNKSANDHDLFAQGEGRHASRMKHINFDFSLLQVSFAKNVYGTCSALFLLSPPTPPPFQSPEIGLESRVHPPHRRLHHAPADRRHRFKPGGTFLETDLGLCQRVLERLFGLRSGSGLQLADPLAVARNRHGNAVGVVFLVRVSELFFWRCFRRGRSSSSFVVVKRKSVLVRRRSHREGLGLIADKICFVSIYHAQNGRSGTVRPLVGVKVKTFLQI